MPRATNYVLRADAVTSGHRAFDIALLAHDERRLRRRLITLAHGDEVMLDLPFTVSLESGDMLALDDGRFAEIIAADERLYEVHGRDATHLMQLAWHLGNRHLPVQIETEWDGIGHRIVVLRDHVTRDMLVGLGATVTELSEPFHPLAGAYHGHAHAEPPNALLNR